MDYIIIDCISFTQNWTGSLGLPALYISYCIAYVLCYVFAFNLARNFVLIINI